MADKQMNQFNTGSSATYVYAEAADGSQVRINIENLRASLFTMKTYSGDLNSIILGPAKYEVYKLNSECTNVPYDGNGSICIVFSYDGWVIHQVYIGGSGQMWCRTCFGPSKWQAWRKCYNS